MTLIGDQLSNNDISTNAILLSVKINEKAFYDLIWKDRQDILLNEKKQSMYVSIYNAFSFV